MKIDQVYIVMGLSMIVIPYLCWIGASIFSMRTDIELLKQSNSILARIEKLLRDQRH